MIYIRKLKKGTDELLNIEHYERPREEIESKIAQFMVRQTDVNYYFKTVEESDTDYKTIDLFFGKINELKTEIENMKNSLQDIQDIAGGY